MSGAEPYILSLLGTAGSMGASALQTGPDQPPAQSDPAAQSRMRAMQSQQQSQQPMNQQIFGQQPPQGVNTPGINLQQLLAALSQYRGPNG